MPLSPFITSAAAVRRDLQRRDAFAQGCGQGVELPQPQFLQPSGLQVAHHGVDLGHGVCHRRRRREHCPALSGPYGHLGFHDDVLDKFLGELW
jgi:hypothetical protein